MRHSTFASPCPKGLPGYLSKGYRTISEPPSAFELVITAPAGSLTTTAADMGRFMLAHLQQGSLDGNQILMPPPPRACTARARPPSRASA
jgi:CubicO group peptidase (beta-lactamase class C family)